MRRTVLYVLAVSGAAAAFAAEPVILDVFGEGHFEPGQFSISPLDADSRARDADGSSRCIVSPESLMHSGLEAADGRECVHTIVENTSEHATVAYSCRGLGSGRTSIVRDNQNHFTVDAQGISGREPFAVRSEYKRVGDCSN